MSRSYRFIPKCLRTKAYDEGWNAANNKKSANDCPYEIIMNVSRLEWLNGYYDYVSNSKFIKDFLY